MNTTPIEFMAWHTKLNEFVYMHKYCSLGNKDLFQNDCELMQLTALRSINDEPIYNHMIVKSELWGHFLVDMFNYKIMAELSSIQLEIVGNRFQHPELLELCK